jgi:protein SCO1/2
MNIKTVILAVLLFIETLLLCTQGSAQKIQENPKDLSKIDVVEQLGKQIPLDLTFVNDVGDTVPLSNYFNDGKPVILDLAYYTCPMLCNLVLNGINESISKLDWLPGNEYRVLTISFDPRDSVSLAAAKKANYLKALNRPGAEKGWTFFVDYQSHAKALADAVGFEYFWDEDNKQYAHPAVIYILTPEGKISRYLYGITYNEKDLRLGLLEASDGKIGSTVDRILLYCYHYDPEAKGYVMFAGNVMRLGGVITLVLLALLIGILWMKEKRKKAHRHVPAGHATSGL